MQIAPRNGTGEIRGQIRLRLGAAFEAAVADMLRDRRYTVQPFGQGLLIPEVREAIQHLKPAVPWRWTPDLIAVRGKKVALVDPKSGWRDDTGNVAIELAAIFAHRAMGLFVLPIIYVFDTPHGVLTAHHDDVHIRRQVLDTGAIRGGSGTPFVLVHHSTLTPFDDMFGPVSEAVP